MHSAIVVVRPPEGEAEKVRWQSFASAIGGLSDNPAVERLADNVWIVNFQQSPQALARLVSAAERNQFSQRILQLDAAPQWLPVDSNSVPK
jgi:hypothetical protein